jgi:hypothetical protein
VGSAAREYAQKNIGMHAVFERLEGSLDRLRPASQPEPLPVATAR